MTTAALLGCLLSMMIDQAVGSPSRKPTLLWADRHDKLFLTAQLSRSTGGAVDAVHVVLHEEGVVTVTEGGRIMVRLELSGGISPERSTWSVRSGPNGRRAELVLAKRQAGRWLDLLATPYAGEVRTDWSRHVTIEEEEAEYERRAGLHAAPPQSDPGIARKVDDYYTSRTAARLSTDALTSGLPNLGLPNLGLPDAAELMRRAQAEHKTVGGSFDDVVQRLWMEAKARRDAALRLEQREEAWASSAAAGISGPTPSTARHEHRRTGGSALRDEV